MGVTVVPNEPKALRLHPLDHSKHFAAIIEHVDKLADDETGSAGDETGSCHLFWAAKKRILKTQFGLDWESPADLNPNVLFD